jgi:plastocyanin
MMTAGKSATDFVTEGECTSMNSDWRNSLVGTLLFVAVSSPCAYGADITGRVVGENDEGIADAVVFVQTLPPSVTPGAVSQSATLDQIHKEFVPALLPIAVGTQVRFPNHDQIHHHVYSFSRTKSFELPLYKGEEAMPIVFDKPGLVKIGCNIHDWMSAIVFVAPTPYFATTDESGKFVLSNLPTGTYSVACWHKQSQNKVEDTVQQVLVDGTPRAVQFSLTLGAARARPPVRGERGSP